MDDLVLVEVVHSWCNLLSPAGHTVWGNVSPVLQKVVEGTIWAVFHHNTVTGSCCTHTTADRMESCIVTWDWKISNSYCTYTDLTNMLVVSKNNLYPLTTPLHYPVILVYYLGYVKAKMSILHRFSPMHVILLIPQFHYQLFFILSWNIFTLLFFTLQITVWPIFT